MSHCSWLIHLFFSDRQLACVSHQPHGLLWFQLSPAVSECTAVSAKDCSPVVPAQLKAQHSPEHDRATQRPVYSHPFTKLTLLCPIVSRSKLDLALTHVTGVPVGAENQAVCDACWVG
jgi:hypothetical protein